MPVNGHVARATPGESTEQASDFSRLFAGASSCVVGVRRMLAVLSTNWNQGHKRNECRTTEHPSSRDTVSLRYCSLDGH